MSILTFQLVLIESVYNHLIILLFFQTEPTFLLNQVPSPNSVNSTLVIFEARSHHNEGQNGVCYSDGNRVASCERYFTSV